MRDYGEDGQIGLEKTPEEYVKKNVDVFREVKRVLKNDGTVWLNLGDCYAGSGKSFGQKPEHKNCGKIKQKRGYDVPKPTPSKAIGLKPKDLVGIPWRVAFALQADSWYLRSDIIWAKPNPMPESVKDRPTKAHEYIFLLTKSAKYFYDGDAITEPKSILTITDPRGNDNGKRRDRNYPGANSVGGTNLGGPDGKANKRSVWTVCTQPYPEAHFAVFPEKLIEPCIKAGCPKDGVVLDPFGGSGTTAVVSKKLNRKCILIDLKKEYCDMATQRTCQQVLDLSASLK